MGMFRWHRPRHRADAGRADARRPDAGLLVDVGWTTATGPREDNQDRASVAPRWAVISDGAGGHQGGGLAAELTVRAVAARLQANDQADDHADDQTDDHSDVRHDRTAATRAAATREAAVQAADDANAAVRAGRAADGVSSMAATLTLAVAEAVERDGSTWCVLGVGDSPAWLATPEGLRRVTEPDNVAAELLRSGAISPAEARRHPGRHLITRAMGTDERVASSPATVSLRPGDGLVLATDGIEVLDEAAMMEVMSGAPTADRAALCLVEAALARGTRDNVTVAVVRHRHGGGTP